MRSSWIQALAGGCLVATIAGCGGSSDADSNASGRLEITSSTSDDPSLGSGSLQQRTLVLRNTSKTTAQNLRVSVALDAHARQLPLSCEAAAATVCHVDTDGTLKIDQLSAGGSITLHQQLRIKAGYSGAVMNSWTVSSADAALSAQWQQALQSRVADVGLTLQSTTVSGDGATRAVSYVVTLSNAGPDEARDVTWTQTAGIDMPWQGASCSASGGAVCPASLGESIKIAQIPKGGGLSLVLNYGGRTNATTLGTELLASEVHAAGDANATNDRLFVRQADAPGRAVTDGFYDLVDFEGHAWRMTMNFQPGSYRELRFKNDSRELFAGLSVDVTGYGSIELAAGVPSHWYHGGSLNVYGTTANLPSLFVGSFDFGRGLQPFLVARDWVTDVAELEGNSYTIMGSRVDGAGKPVDAYVWPARFAGGTLKICASSTPTSVDACPASDLRAYEAAVVGKDLELMSSTEVMHLRAVRTKSAPVLLRSERAQDDSGATFWIGVPQATSSSIPISLSEASPPMTFASPDGLALPGSFDFEVNAQDQVQFGGGGLPNTYLLYFEEFPDIGQAYCSITGTAQPTPFASLYQGNIVATPWPNSGSTACYQGPVYFARTNEMAVLLGTKDGPLSGRWMITTGE